MPSIHVHAVERPGEDAIGTVHRLPARDIRATSGHRLGRVRQRLLFM
jgi:hypothetical protein